MSENNCYTFEAVSNVAHQAKRLNNHGSRFDRLTTTPALGDGGRSHPTARTHCYNRSWTCNRSGAIF